MHRISSLMIVICVSVGCVLSVSSPIKAEVGVGVTEAEKEIAIQAALAYPMVRREDGHKRPVYIWRRGKVAELVAKYLRLDLVRLEDAWNKTPRVHQAAIMAGLSQVGKPYLFGEESPTKGFDCSGFTWYAWLTAGVKIPRTIASQLSEKYRINPDKARAGSVLGRASHVYLYLGIDYAVVASPLGGRHVTLRIIVKDLRKGLTWSDPTKGLVARPIAANY